MRNAESEKWLAHIIGKLVSAMLPNPHPLSTDWIYLSEFPRMFLTAEHA